MQMYGLFDKDGLPIGFYTEAVHGPYRLPIHGATPDPTEENPAPVAEVIGDKANPAYPDSVVPISNEQWREMIDNSGHRRWDGKAVVEYVPPPPPPVVPAIVADYQFSGQAAAEGIISFEEAMAWTARGEIPAVLLAAVDQAVADQERRKAVLLFLAGAKDYPRHHPLTPILGPLLGKDDDAALDAFWIAAGAR